MTCPRLPADLIAYTDQRAAATQEFLDVMIAEARTDVAFRGVSHPLSVIADAEVLIGFADVETVADALALAIRRLAAL